MLSKFNPLKSSNSKSLHGNRIDYISYSGNYTFFAEINAVGVSPFQSCNLVANAYTKNDKNYSLPANFKWFRIRGTRVYELSGVNTNTFQLSSADIGSIIKVEISSEDDDYSGKAICEFGPVVMDPNLKRNLEALLVNSKSSFSVQVENEKESKFYSSELSISEKELMLSESENLFKFKISFSLEQPQIEINSRDCTKIAFVFHPLNLETEMRIKLAEICGNVNRINLVFKSRHNRDLACLAAKSLAIKSYLLHSKAIASSINLFTERKFRDDPNFLENLIEIEALKKEVNFLVEFSNTQIRAKEKLAKEVKDIEEELNTTIETFNKLFAEIKTAQQNASKHGAISNPMIDLSKLSNLADYDAKKKCKELEYEKRQLQRRIDELEGKDAGFFNESMIWVPGEDAISLTSNSMAFNPILNLSRMPSQRQPENVELSNQLQTMKQKVKVAEEERESALKEMARLREEKERADSQLEKYADSSVLNRSQSMMNESGIKSIIEFHEEIYNENLRRMEGILRERKSQIEQLKSELSDIRRQKDKLDLENDELKSRLSLSKFGQFHSGGHSSLMEENTRLKAELRFAHDSQQGDFRLKRENEELRLKIITLESQLVNKERELMDARRQDYSILSRDSSRLEGEAELVYLKGKVKSLEKANDSIALERDQLLVALSKANANIL